MPFLFAYGTLQEGDVQRATFGRLLHGEDDALVGFERSTTARNLVNVTFTGRTADRVAGMVFEVTDADLAAADRYEERAAYARITGTLVSGREAWVYVDAGRTELRCPRIESNSELTAQNSKLR
jgi:gamma-glutamylcyclotransferase (GGCT)/AIG2-like uncharacterized protein YtfP